MNQHDTLPAGSRRHLWVVAFLVLMAVLMAGGLYMGTWPDCLHECSTN